MDKTRLAESKHTQRLSRGEECTQRERNFKELCPTAREQREVREVKNRSSTQLG